MDKKQRRSIAAKLIGLAAGLGFVGIALGWGSYGHQQINAAAIKLMDESNPLAACFKRNATLITRYAITPDYEWKKVGKMPSDPDLVRKKLSNDHYEHPLHFFEPDAFIKDGKVTPEAIAALPTGGFDKDDPTGSYRRVYEKYRDLRKDNEAYITKLDPKKALADPKNPTAAEVTGHGTAPWRIQQLYRMGVEELKKGNVEKALYYLGTMGHYVGDMSQPFHGSVNYNPGGIHSVFEEKILEEAAHPFAGAEADGATNLWKSFEGTEKDVLARGQDAMKGLGKVGIDNVVGEAIKLVGGGVQYVDPLMKVFDEAKKNYHPPRPPRQGLMGRQQALLDSADPTSRLADSLDEMNRKTPPSEPGEDHDHAHEAHRHPSGKERPREPSVPIGVVRDFMRSTLTDPTTGKQGTVLDAATRRMGDGAALLARIWETAYREARAENPRVDAIADCEKKEFDLHFTIMNYPRPDYLPNGAYPPPPQDHPHGATPAPGAPPAGKGSNEPAHDEKR